MRSAVNDIILEGYPLSAILSQLHDRVVTDASVRDVDKALICEKIAQADENLSDGASEALQLLDVAAFVMRRLRNEPADADSANCTH